MENYSHIASIHKNLEITLCECFIPVPVGVNQDFRERQSGSDNLHVAAVNGLEK